MKIYLHMYNGNVQQNPQRVESCVTNPVFEIVQESVKVCTTGMSSRILYAQHPITNNFHISPRFSPKNLHGDLCAQYTTFDNGVYTVYNRLRLTTVTYTGTVFFTLTDRASTIPSNIRGCQSGTWSAGQKMYNIDVDALRILVSNTRRDRILLLKSLVHRTTAL